MDYSFRELGGGWGGSWVCSFYIKNKLNSEIFYQTGNSAKNLVTFKIWMGLRTKNFNIMGVHWKIQFLRGVHKKPIYMEGLPKKSGGRLGQFADLRGRLAKKRTVVFLRGLTPQCPLCMMKAYKLKRLDKVAANNKKIIKYLHSNIKWQLQMQHL